MHLCALSRTMVESALYTIAWLAFYGYIAAIALLGLAAIPQFNSDDRANGATVIRHLSDAPAKVVPFRARMRPTSDA